MPPLYVLPGRLPPRISAMTAGLIRHSLATRCATLALIGLTWSLVGCVSPDGIAGKARPLDAGGLTSASLAGAAQAAWPTSGWWQQLGDGQLDSLMREALAASPSLVLAQARIDRARAWSEATNAAYRPSVTADASLTREHFPEHYLYPPPYAGSNGNIGRAGLDFSYEFDFWGKHRAALESALSQEKAAQADAATARLLLQVAVAKSYARLASLFDAADVAQAVVAQRRQRVDLARQRLAAGLDSPMDLRQLDASLAAAQAEASQVDQAMVLNRNQLAALLGQGPERGRSIARPTINADALALPPVLAADLLGRRPDLVASRWRVEAAAGQEALARAQFYPDVNLMGFVGLASLSLSSWLDLGSRDATISPAISLPIFDGGRRRANLQGRSAERDQAIAQYNQTLLDAVHDVADQVAAIQGWQRQLQQTQAALSAAQAAHELAEGRFRAGLSDRMKVLDAQTAVLTQQRLASDLAGNLLAARLDLIRALGGCYPDDAQPQPNRQE